MLWLLADVFLKWVLLQDEIKVVVYSSPKVLEQVYDNFSTPWCSALRQSWKTIAHVTNSRGKTGKHITKEDSTEGIYLK